MATRKEIEDTKQLAEGLAMIVRVPKCCVPNVRHGFVRAVDFNVDGFATQWETKLVSANGEKYDYIACRCPACGHYLHGVEVVDCLEQP